MMIQQPGATSWYIRALPGRGKPASCGRGSRKAPPAKCRSSLALLMFVACLGQATDPEQNYPEPPGTQAREVARLGIEMVPVDSTFQLESGSIGTSVRCPFGQPFSFIETWMAPPHGVQLLRFEFVGNDSNPVNDQAMFAFRICQSAIDSPSPSATATLLGSVTSGNPFSGGFAVALDLSATNEIVDAHQCRYLLRARLSSQNQVCTGADMEIHKIVIRYRNTN